MDNGDQPTSKSEKEDTSCRKEHDSMVPNIAGVFEPKAKASSRHDFVKTTSYDPDPSRVPDRNIFDTHCHLDRLFLSYKSRTKLGITESLPAFMKRFKALRFLKDRFPAAFGPKFEGCISNCCDPDTWRDRDLYEWLMAEDGVSLAFGCHPSKAHLFDASARRLLRRYLRHDKVVALGEIGLDSTYYGTRATQYVQRRVFREQLEMALEARKPLVIHLRGSVVEDALDVMKDTLVSFSYSCFAVFKSRNPLSAASRKKDNFGHSFALLQLQRECCGKFHETLSRDEIRSRASLFRL